MMHGREELEARLIDDPTDLEARQIYADLLMSRGDARGELIALGLRGEHAAADAYFEEHAHVLLGPLARYATVFDGSEREAFEWHLGFIRAARFGYCGESAGDLDEDPKECTVDQVLAATLPHPSLKLLERLVLTINQTGSSSPFDAATAALAKHGAPALRALRIGEYAHAGPGGPESDYNYENSWTSLGDASELWAAVPRVEELVLQVNLGQATIGTFDLPKLRRLEVISGGVNARCVRAFAAAKLPATEYIDLWFGRARHGSAGTSVLDLAALFAGDGLPRVSHLGLLSSELTDAICVELARSAILPRLAELDLSHGTMTDAGAAALATNPSAMANLKRLAVANNYLTNDGYARLRAACPHVEYGVQRTTTHEDDYYAALGE